VTADQLARALVAAGAADPENTGSASADAGRAMAPWLGAIDADEATAGLAAAADPVLALHQLARLLEGAGAPPPPGRVAPLLGILGGSPALAAVLLAEGPAWTRLLDAVLDVPTRDVAGHRAHADAPCRRSP